jgi:hypothetical protein
MLDALAPGLGTAGRSVRTLAVIIHADTLWSIGIIGGTALIVILSVICAVQYGGIRFGLAAILRKVNQSVLSWLEPARHRAPGGNNDQ